MNEAKHINYGIELLRILCMLMIVMMHLLYKGGILYSDSLPGSVIEQAWLIEAFCYGAVNCYVMISGWLLVHDSEIKKGRAAELWIETLLYSVTIGVICFCLFEGTKRMLLVKSFFPVLSNSYWFITSYLVLYLLHPILNRIIKCMDEKKFRGLLLLLMVVFCIWPNVVPFFETLDTSQGYSFIWFVFLYLTGAYLRLFHESKKQKGWLMTGYILFSLGIYFSRIICLKIGENIDFFNYYSYSAYAYNSILVFGASICLFLLFANGVGQAKIHKRVASGILLFSKVTLDVYLIHEQVILREHLWTELLPVRKYAASGYFGPIAFTIVLILFGVCAMIGQIRQEVFKIVRYKGRKRREHETKTV